MKLIPGDDGSSRHRPPAKPEKWLVVQFNHQTSPSTILSGPKIVTAQTAFEAVQKANLPCARNQATAFLYRGTE